MDIQTILTDRTTRALVLEQEAFQVVRNLVTAALLECCSVDEFNGLTEMSVIECVSHQAWEDLSAFARKDPAAGGDPICIARTYTSYAAVMHYRLAHWIHLNARWSVGSSDQTLAAMVSRRGKLMSGAEIHFRSKIGARFIIDHGVGTVIGETSIIGDDCYILGGVTLGARGIGGNPATVRHPHIGDRVQIGAFSSVLGAVDIGDDVFIGPGCIVTTDVPTGARVQIRTSQQVVLAR